MERSRRTNPKCSRCGAPATMFRDETNLCQMHYRSRQMTKTARRHGKIVPDNLDAMLREVEGRMMKCPVCERVMNWLLKDGHSTVVTLQHDRDGAIRLMCFGCNSKHARHPGDSYYEIPKGYKRCPTCEKVKPADQFYFIKTRKAPSSRCRVCEKAATLAHYHKRKAR